MSSSAGNAGKAGKHVNFLNCAGKAGKNTKFPHIIAGKAGILFFLILYNEF